MWTSRLILHSYFKLLYNLILLFSDAEVVKTIKTDDVDVRGVTSLNDELFVLLDREDNQVASVVKY